VGGFFDAYPTAERRGDRRGIFTNPDRKMGASMPAIANRSSPDLRVADLTARLPRKARHVGLDIIDLLMEAQRKDMYEKTSNFISPPLLSTSSSLCSLCSLWFIFVSFCSQ
jgi:hypothetical protein